MSAQSNGREVAVSAGRFPWIPEWQERYGIDKVQWRALIDAVFPSAKSLDSVILALSYCKARGLDVFKRPVHIVPMYDKNRGGTVDTIWPGIGELRTTAVRTGQFAGRDAANYGPTVTKKYGAAEIEHPEWCEVVVYKIVEGHRVAFHGPRVYWRETYATKKHDDPAPNSMWTKRPFGQLEKCAEAAALRVAFPEEIGNEYCADEMEGKIIDGHFSQVNEAPAPAATKQLSRNKLAAFAADDAEPPTDDQLAVIRARVTAICETIAIARSKSVIAKIEKSEREFMATLDDVWPEGKDRITAAIAAAEESLSESEGSRADLADGYARAEGSAREDMGAGK